MASLASGILVQTAARTVMMAPDWKHRVRETKRLVGFMNPEPASVFIQHVRITQGNHSEDSLKVKNTPTSEYSYPEASYSDP